MAMTSAQSNRIEATTAPEIKPERKNRRRSWRVIIGVPVSVFGKSSGGQLFREETHTLTVSLQGGLILMKADVDDQKPLLIINAKNGAETECHVTHRKQTESGHLEIGIEFIESYPRFWGISFPPMDWDPAERKKPSVRSK